MSITVRDALAIGGLQHSRLVAGRTGLDRVISCVDILEVPDASLWLRENELLITTCYAVRSDPEGQLNIIRAMARSGAAALAVKFGRFVGEPPPAMIKLADEFGVPLIDVPDGISFLDITHPLMTAIVNNQAERLAYSEKIHRRLTQLSLEQNGLPPVADELAQLLNRAVLVVSDDCEALAAAGIIAEDQTQILAILQENPELEQIGAVSAVWSVFPVDVQKRRYGYIIVSGSEQAVMTDMHQIAIEHAITIVALQLAREEAVREAKHSYKRDFLEDLIAGAITNREMAITRGDAIGLRLNEPYFIMVADIDGFTGVLAKLQQQPEVMARQIKAQLLNSVERAAQIWQQRTMIVNRSDSVVVVLSANRKQQLSDTRKKLAVLAAQIREQIKQRQNYVTVTIGISRMGSEPCDFSANYNHVREMIRMVRRLYGKGRTVFWDDMEIYGLLTRAGRDLEHFYQAVLGAIDNPQIKNRQELLDTLERYLECQGNAIEAAEKLYIHRNTLRYRLERITSLLGRGLDNPDYRFTLWMALKARHLIERG